MGVCACRRRNLPQRSRRLQKLEMRYVLPQIGLSLIIWCGHNWSRNWQTQVLHFSHNRMNLAVLWSHVLLGCKALSVGKALWPVIAEVEIECRVLFKRNSWSISSSYQHGTFAERIVCPSGCNEDIGSAVDKITPADCKASGKSCTDTGCGYSYTGERVLNEVVRLLWMILYFLSMHSLCPNCQYTFLEAISAWKGRCQSFYPSICCSTAVLSNLSCESMYSMLWASLVKIWGP